MSGSYDSLVSGAGHNGLVTGAYLARAGQNVLLLEARDVVGGAAATEEVFPGYRVDTGAHRIGGLSAKVVDDHVLPLMQWYVGNDFLVVICRAAGLEKPALP